MSELNEQLIPSEPLSDRIPKSLAVVLEELWTKHTGQENSGHYGDNQPYRNLAPQVGLTLEHLVKIGKLQPIASIFDPQGRLISTASKEALKTAFLDGKLLHGLSVFVLGGTEGRIFAEMGAQTINLNDNYLKISPSDVSNLQELSEPLEFNFVFQHKEEFDLTFSSRVFDSGSGMAWNMLGYENYFRMLLEMTKQGGLAIHHGDQMGKMTNEVTKYLDCKVIEIAPVNKSDLETNFFPTVYVIQKGFNSN